MQSEKPHDCSPARQALLQIASALTVTAISASGVSIGLLGGMCIALALSGPDFSSLGAAADPGRLVSIDSNSEMLAIVDVGNEQRGWADVFEDPSRDSGRSTQVLLGETVQVLTHRGRWSQVSILNQGVVGWIESHRLAPSKATGPSEPGKGLFATVTHAPGAKAKEGLYLLAGTRLPVAVDGASSDSVRLQLPRGEQVTVALAEVQIGPGGLPLSQSLERIRRFRGISYQTGANSAEAMDAAGLIHLAYRLAGVAVPRSVERLQASGASVSFQSAQAGDVVFLSTFNPSRPHPVLLLDDGQTFIHASPSQGVALGLLSQLRTRTVLSVRRYTDQD